MDHINIPGCKHNLFDGSVVILKRFPDSKWVVHIGWYWYEDQQYHGWYFKSIPEGDIIPATPEDFEDIIIVSSGGDWDEGCPHPHPPCPPCPPGPPCPVDKPAKFTQSLYDELKSSFITVDTLEDLEKVRKKDIKDGRIAKVNDVDGVVKYYKFSEEEQTWIPDTTISDITEQVEDLANNRCMWTSF